MDVCVVGIGNPWASDDGVGIEVVRRLQSNCAALSQPTETHHLAGRLPQVTCLTLPQPAVELIDLMDRCRLFFLVDGVRSGAPAGTLHREVWHPGLLASRGVERASSHGLGIGQVLELAATLDRLPERVILWGVEISTTEPGLGLSPAVAAVLPVLVDCLCQELEAQLGEGKQFARTRSNQLE